MNNTSASVPQPKGKGKERQDVNDVDASSEPSDDETCDADVVCRYCETWRNMKIESVNHKITGESIDFRE